MRRIIYLALMLRLIIAPFFYHPDVLDQLNWAKNIELKGLGGFYERDIPDAGPPNYPPLYFLTITASNNVYLLTRNVVWFFNTNISFFPSNFYLWYESDSGRIYYNKLLPILCDLGMGYLIFLIIKKFKNTQTAKLAGVAYLFLPPSWYISSVWGQTDSVFLLPLLLAFYQLNIRKNYFWPLLLFTISFLIKPTAVLFLPALLLPQAQGDKKEIAKSILISAVIFSLVHLPFNLSIMPLNLMNFYTHGVREISGYISSNAFNLWGLVFGFGPVKDNLVWNSLSVNHWGLIISVLPGSYFLYRLIKQKDTSSRFLNATLFSYSTFLFLTRMHERYFYLTFILLLITSFLYKKIRWVLYLASFIFFINLYHFWWVPGGDLFKYMLSNRIVEIGFCLANLYLFFYLERFREKINLHGQKD